MPGLGGRCGLEEIMGVGSAEQDLGNTFNSKDIFLKHDIFVKEDSVWP